MTRTVGHAEKQVNHYLKEDNGSGLLVRMVIIKHTPGKDLAIGWHRIEKTR
jgi:hypothetical protein